MGFYNVPEVVWTFAKDYPDRGERIVYGGSVVEGNTGNWVGEIYKKIIDLKKGTTDLRYLDHARFDKLADCRAWVMAQKARKPHNLG